MKLELSSKAVAAFFLKKKKNKELPKDACWPYPRLVES